MWPLPWIRTFFCTKRHQCAFASVLYIVPSFTDWNICLIELRQENLKTQVAHLVKHPISNRGVVPELETFSSQFFFSRICLLSWELVLSKLFFYVMSPPGWGTLFYEKGINVHLQQPYMAIVPSLTDWNICLVVLRRKHLRAR